MTLRGRLSYALVAILCLFLFNLAIHWWGHYRRAQFAQELRNAVDRKMLVATIRRKVHDRLMHIALLRDIRANGRPHISQQQLLELRGEMDSISADIQNLTALSDGPSMLLVDELRRVYRDLRESWDVFYSNFGGANHSLALNELKARGDTLRIKAVQDLDALSQQEARLVEEASETFHRVATLTNRWTAAILFFSAFLAMGMALLLYRQIAQGLAVLKEGVSAIGRGDLDHQIEVVRRDELGQLGQAFNSMTENLRDAQMQLTSSAEELESRHQEVEKERQVSLSLLHNILPAEIAGELQSNGRVDPKYFEDVSILFLDFVGFTLATERLAAEELVQLLQHYFTTFDRIVDRYGLEKLKTIGDAYMCAGGLPVRNPSHAVDIVLAAFEMVRAVEFPEGMGGAPMQWKARVGIHTGPVIAGVVGITKFAFDIWGDTVNYSSRMESSGLPNCVNLSASTYSRVKDFIECEKRGKVKTKEGREVEMYLANKILPKLIDNDEQSPPPAFLRRYRIYFQKDPPAFPDFLLRRETGPASPPKRPDPHQDSASSP